MGKALIAGALAFIVAVVVLTAIMTRYELLSIERGAVYRVDRWTGQTLLCVAATCTQVEVLPAARSTPTAPVTAIPITTTWWIEQDTMPDAVPIIAGEFDLQAACKEALSIARGHKTDLRLDAYFCRPTKAVSTDPKGHWWVVAHPVTRVPPRASLNLVQIFGPEGPYGSKSICEAARLDHDYFDDLSCQRK